MCVAIVCSDLVPVNKLKGRPVRRGPVPRARGPGTLQGHLTLPRGRTDLDTVKRGSTAVLSRRT